MTNKLTIDEKIDQMRIDLTSIKTDVKWLKTLYMIIIVAVFTIGSTALAMGGI